MHPHCWSSQTVLLVTTNAFDSPVARTSWRMVTHLSDTRLLNHSTTLLRLPRTLYSLSLGLGVSANARECIRFRETCTQRSHLLVAPVRSLLSSSSVTIGSVPLLLCTGMILNSTGLQHAKSAKESLKSGYWDTYKKPSELYFLLSTIPGLVLVASRHIFHVARPSGCASKREPRISHV